MEVPQDEERLLHALVIPYPLQGHITPLLHLSLKLASSYGVRITFVLTQHTFQIISASLTVSAHLPIKIVGLPDGLPAAHPRQSTVLDSYEGAMGMEPAVDGLIQELAGHGQLPSFILSDTFVTWGYRLAQRHSVEHVAFATTNMAAASLMASTAKLIRLGVLPLKAISGSSKYADEMITCIPGIPPLHPEELPTSLRSPTLSHYRLKFVVEQFEQASKSRALLVNSAYDIEKSAFDAHEIKAPVYGIGPALILNGESFALNGVSASLFVEEEGCLLWLDKQASGSVLYVSFGSVAVLAEEQFVELALGLEASQQPFLWVVRRDSCTGYMESLPADYMDRIKGRGTIISWAPQLKVLSHFATGGFLTHCGWNSVSENLCLGGVPMLCWPMENEQALNCKVITDVWQVGIKVERGDDDLVHRGEVQRVVQALLQEEGARTFKSTAQELRQKVKRAVQDGGSSLRSIESVLGSIRQAIRK